MNLEDINPLAELQYLTKLRLNLTKVKNLSPLSKLKHLDFLDISLTKVVDLKSLENLNIKELRLSSTKIREKFSVLNSLTKLEIVAVYDMENCEWMSLENFSNTNLQYLGADVEYEVIAENILENLQSNRIEKKAGKNSDAGREKEEAHSGQNVLKI